MPSGEKSAIGSAASRSSAATAWSAGARTGRVAGPPPPPATSAQPALPMSGTKRTPPRSRRWKPPSAPRVISTSRWTEGSGPIGITSRPPSASCSSSAGGASGPPAATTMAS